MAEPRRGRRNGHVAPTTTAVIATGVVADGTRVKVPTQQRAPAVATQPPLSTNARLPTRRVTVDAMGYKLGSMPVIEPPPDPEGDWLYYNLDANTLAAVSPTRLLSMLADVSPEVSRALWDFLRLFNPGWELTCWRPGTDTPYDEALGRCMAYNHVLQELYGTVEVVHGRLAMGAFMRGALFSEVVLDGGREFIDFATPDPMSVRFERFKDPKRGTVHRLGQLQYGQNGIGGFLGEGSSFQRLDNAITVSYIPIDPAPASPYGRPMLAPALFASLFMLGLLHDLRRVISQQGYPRIDLTVDLVKLKEEAPKDVQQNEARFRVWASEVFEEIKRVYSQLEPDDAYAHSTAVTVGRPVGATDTSSLGAIPGIIEIIERWLIRALKTMPITFASIRPVSEAQANREWEIQTAGIASIQHYAEVMWQHQFQLALRAEGILADVELRYATLRASEELRDQQSLALKIDNNFRLEMLGYQSHETSGHALTGHAPPVDEPIMVPSTFTEFGASVNNPKTVNPGDEPAAIGRANVLSDPQGYVDARRAELWLPGNRRVSVHTGRLGKHVRALTHKGPSVVFRMPRFTVDEPAA